MNKQTKRIFDAGIDRLDLRDREYRPPLVSISAQWPLEEDIIKYFYNYIRDKMVLDQGSDGACTGFGLAAVINYILWRDELKPQKIRVSPRMLYHMAKIYDEWDDEDYNGSSCRGAMKGWHRHGVCLEKSWRSDYPDSDQWAKEATDFTLGAYYRIDKNSINDMQSAIREVGAIFCSATVGAGWDHPKKIESFRPPNLMDMLPVIADSDVKKGGHAFAVIGYNSSGFIIQNSWGMRWGYRGFAILPYEEWLKNGNDAWVAVMGVPAKIDLSPRTYSNYSLNSLSTKSLADNQTPVSVWSESKAYEHTLVLRNNGHVRSPFTDRSIEESIHQICFENILSWMNRSAENRKIMIYAHGGLTSEKSNLKRICTMAPYFKANGIYPLFVTWKTGFLETIVDQLEDNLTKSVTDKDAKLSGGVLDSLLGKFKKAKDHFLELACRKGLVTGIWSEIKENAKLANSTDLTNEFGFYEGGMVSLSHKIKDLKREYRDCELHLIGHSAGSIIFGYWMDILAQKGLRVDSINLYAPVCTMEFANEHYRNEDVLAKDSLYVHILDDELEKEDHVGPYGMSLSYLVSRALEKRKNTPLLGLMSSWTPDEENEDFMGFCDKESIFKWLEYAGNDVKCLTYVKNLGEVKMSVRSNSVAYAHGSFDNDIKVIEDTIKRIKGTDKLDYRVENLVGY